MYTVVVPIHLLAKISLVLIFKTLGPMLYGLFGWSIFMFCTRRLLWSKDRALYAVLFACTYFVTIRISWDAFQAELGLILFLLAQSISPPNISLKSEMIKISLLSLAVLSNQLVGVLVFVTQLVVLLRFLRSSTSESQSIITLQFPPIAVFLLILYATIQTPIAPGLAVIGSPANLPNLLENLSFLFYSYAFVIPLFVFGRRLHGWSLFSPWTLVCGAGLILSALPGYVFQDIGYRWTLLLSIPLLMLAYEGYCKLLTAGAFAAKRWNGLLRLAVVVCLAGSAITYTVIPAESALPFYTIYPQYLPSSMIQSSLPSSDYPNVVNAMVWVNSHLNSDSVIITHQAFYGWARYYLSLDKQIVNSFLASPTSVIGETISYSHVFTIWWVKGTGWFQSSFPTGAKPLILFGNIAVYEYR